MMNAGIDYSMTCPAITIGNSTDYKKCKTFYYNNSKKFEGRFNKNIFGFLHLPYEHEMERFENIAEWAMSILLRFKITHVTLEGFAMAGKGRVFAIAENTGLLKYKMWQNNILYDIPAPTTVKKFFTGKGNANKEQMHDAFVERTGVSIAKIMGTEKDRGPTSDIVDSYAMLCYGLESMV